MEAAIVSNVERPVVLEYRLNNSVTPPRPRLFIFLNKTPFWVQYRCGENGASGSEHSIGELTMTDFMENILVLPKKKRQSQQQSRHVPRYNVILWNDDDHSYEYVVLMLRALFGYVPEKGFLLAQTVDKRGNAILLTTTKEHAELKQEQIHAFGPDPLIPQCAGSMTATIEPVEQE